MNPVSCVRLEENEDKAWPPDLGSPYATHAAGQTATARPLPILCSRSLNSEPSRKYVGRVRCSFLTVSAAQLMNVIILGA